MDWRVFLVCIATLNLIILFIDWFAPELRATIWRAVGGCWLYIDSLDVVAIPRAVAHWFARLAERVLGPRYISARAVLLTSIWTICLLYFLSVTAGLLRFDDVRSAQRALRQFETQIELQSVGQPYVPSQPAPPSFAREYKEYFLLLDMEPLWYLALLLTACVLCNLASTTVTRVLSRKLASAQHVWTSLASILICLASYFVLTYILFVILNFRPSLAEINYDMQVATSIFWVRSVLPLVSLVPLALFALSLIILILKLLGSPIRWFAERLLRRLLESEKGVLSAICGGTTAILALLNLLLRLVGTTVPGK